MFNQFNLASKLPNACSSAAMSSNSFVDEFLDFDFCFDGLLVISEILDNDQAASF